MNAHPAFQRVDHRPYPLPSGRWTWRQRWCDLLFAHWRVPAEALRPLIPEGLHVDTFDGTGWIGVVPFRMEGVMRRPFPDVPGLSAFPELNVRTYVERDGMPGVWFFSLDAANSLAVLGGRVLFRLPYFRADMEVSPTRDGIAYRSRRRFGGPSFEADYAPVSEVYESAQGSLAHFLTARYCLYSVGRGERLLRTDVHHVPWLLQDAEAVVSANEMVPSFDLSAPPVLHFARRIDVVVWAPRSVT